jgi:integrase/recombinase XerD
MANKMEDANDLLFRFKEHLQVLNRSISTINAYTGHLKSFLAGKDCRDMKQVTRSMLEAYIAGLYDYRDEDNKPYSIATISLKVRALKRFFEYLEQSNVVFINPAEFIHEPKKEKTLPRAVLAPDEANKILDQPNLGTLKGIRDRAVLEVFYSTGIRLSELCRLTVYDADLTGGMLRINQGKGKKDRIVPLGKHAVRFLREYIAKVRPHFTRKNRSNRNLFVDFYGKALSAQVVEIMVRDCARAAGIEKKVSPHTFRHSFATALIKNGADVVAVQKMLGHVSLSTTQVYIRRLGLGIKAVHQKTHPREKDNAQGGKPQLVRMRPRSE